MKEKQSYNRKQISDIKNIVESVLQIDHSRDSNIEEALKAANDTEFMSEIGQKYIDRLNGIYNHNEESRTCIVCQKKGAKNRVVCNRCIDKYRKFSLNPVSAFADTIDDLVDGDGFVRLKVKDLFSEVFKKHTTEEAEELFICGTKTTTPKVEEISSDWPKPWLYFRVAMILFISFVILECAVVFLDSTLSIPGLFFIGVLIVPLSVLVMFFELNAPRNISFYRIAEIFAVGGCSSILVALLLFKIVPTDGSLGVIDALMVGIVEETAKLFITVRYFRIMRSEGKKIYLLNALLIGAAVGAGFAVFESAGYAFVQMLGAETIEDAATVVLDVGSMLGSVFIRGVLSPGNHLAWTAIAGFAAVKYSKKGFFRVKDFFSIKFLAVFIYPILFHAVWDMNIEILGIPLLKQLVLIVFTWIVLLVFIDNGLDEINIICRERLARKIERERADINEAIEMAEKMAMEGDFTES